jgi:glutathione peroxidase
MVVWGWHGIVVGARTGVNRCTHYDRGPVPTRRASLERTMATETPSSIYDFEALSIQGKPAHLGSQRGKVILVVNTASACGFTPQFAGLEQLWQDYRDRGLVIVGFPSNEFGAQDPGSNDQIESFCQVNYGVSFPMMAKVKVNGREAHPLWQWLKAQAPGMLGTEGIKWNFTKFLVKRNGQVWKRYAPNDTPESLRKDIEAALAEAA